MTQCSLYIIYIKQCSVYCHCQLHTVHCTLYTTHCTISNCTLPTVYCPLHTAHCTLHTVYCTLYTAHCTVYNAQTVEFTGATSVLCFQCLILRSCRGLWGQGRVVWCGCIEWCGMVWWHWWGCMVWYGRAVWCMVRQGWAQWWYSKAGAGGSCLFTLKVWPSAMMVIEN